MSWVKYAKPGDKVTMDVEGNGSWGYYNDIEAPRPGVIYTIREIIYEVCDFWLLLDEIVNDPEPTPLGEPMFEAGVFRPVQSRPTSISVFTDMLKSAPAPVLEEA